LVVEEGGFEDVRCARSAGSLQVSDHPGEGTEADSSSSNDRPSFLYHHWREGLSSVSPTAAAAAAAIVLGLVGGGVGGDGRGRVACFGGGRAFT
jgi:hypothetical protein